MDKFDVAVIGGGGAGIMAYLRAVLNRDNSVLFTGSPDTNRKGRALWVAEVDNIPGMHDVRKPITASGKTTLKWIGEQQYLADVHNVVKAAVSDIRVVEGGFELDYETKKAGKQTVFAKFVINATGIMDVQPHIGESIKPILPFANNYDVLYCIRCDGHKTFDKTLSVIGNTDTAIGIAAMMVERYDHATVKIMCNGLEPEFSESRLELAEAYNMTIHKAKIKQIRGEVSTGLEGYELEDDSFVETNCSIVSLGIIAYNQLIKAVGAEVDEVGRAIVGPKFESTTPNFFVVGDLVKGRKMQIYTAWDEAVDAADEINRRLRMAKRKERVAAFQGQS